MGAILVLIAGIPTGGIRLRKPLGRQPQTRPHRLTRTRNTYLQTGLAEAGPALRSAPNRPAPLVPFEHAFATGVPQGASRHPVDVGERSEAIILAELVKRGYRVLIPYGTNHRYDIVINVGGRFLRAQCKTGRLRDGVIRFATASTRANTLRATPSLTTLIR